MIGKINPELMARDIVQDWEQKHLVQCEHEAIWEIERMIALGVTNARADAVQAERRRVSAEFKEIGLADPDMAEQLSKAQRTIASIRNALDALPGEDAVVLIRAMRSELKGLRLKHGS